MSNIKKTLLLKQGMKLMTDPRVMKIMQDERVMKAVMDVMSGPWQGADLHRRVGGEDRQRDEPRDGRRGQRPEASGASPRRRARAARKREEGVVERHMRGRGLILCLAFTFALAPVAGCKRSNTKSAFVSVSVSHLKANGKAWDADENGSLDARPDLAVCISYADGRHCYNGDKPNVSEAVCKETR